MLTKNANLSLALSGVLAQAPKPAEGRITNPLFGSALKNILIEEGGIGFFKRFLPSVIGLILIIGTVVFVFMLLVGAIQWISSGGDKANVESARGRITNALMGLIVLFSAFAIIILIEKFFGINILTLDIGVLKIQ